MEESLALKIREANMSLISNGNLDRVCDFFTSEYTVHLTDRVMNRKRDLSNWQAVVTLADDSTHYPRPR